MTTRKCYRCNGLGKVKWTMTAGGMCFRCIGSGRIEVSERTARPAKREPVTLEWNTADTVAKGEAFKALRAAGVPYDEARKKVFGA